MRNHKPRIGLMDTGLDVITKMSEGNPGATKVLAQLMMRETLDGLGTILLFDTIGLYGRRIYMLWNDCCDRDLERVLQIMEAFRSGKIIIESIHEHVQDPRGTAFTDQELGIEQGGRAMKIPPLIQASKVDDEMAISILENAIFNMSMNEDLNNMTLCLLAAMRRGHDALVRERTKEKSHDKE